MHCPALGSAALSCPFRTGRVESAAQPRPTASPPWATGAGHPDSITVVKVTHQKKQGDRE